MRPLSSMMLLGGLAFASLNAQAQSNVTLYGAIDAGFTYVSNEGGAHNWTFADPVLVGNRWGIRGIEDLGGGVKTVFALENGFRLGNGTILQGGALFGRQAFVGLQNSLGALTLGRQYDFTWDFVEAFNVSAFASGYAIHQGDFDRMFGDRFNNALKFTSADFNGLTFGAMYSFSNQPGNFHVGSGWSAGAHYQNGPFTTGAAYTQVNGTTFDPYAQIGVKTFLGKTVATVDPATGTVTDLAPAFPIDKQATFGIGASYAIGRLSAIGNYTYTTIKGLGATSRMRVFEFGGTYDVTAALQGVLGYQHTTFEDSRWNQFTGGLKYSLSKRTAVYVSGDYLTASKQTDAVIGASFPPSSNGRQVDLRVGVRHFF